LARLVGIDYGKKRVGIAVTDPLQIIATALTTVHEKEVIVFLQTYTSREKVEKFIVGYPLHLDGNKMEITTDVDQFIRKLRKHFPEIDVIKEDERLTSKMAVRTLIDAGVPKKKRQDKKLIDKVSATIILQSYLEQQQT